MPNLKRIALLLLLLSPVSAHADDGAPTRHSQHEAFAHSFANTVLAIIQDTKKNYAERKEILRTAFAKSVDIDWIAKFVLGKSWASATPEQRDRYTQLYRKFLTETYVSNFAENPDKRIRDIKIDSINGDTEVAQEDDFTVRTEMMLASQENLKVSYLVHEEEKHYKVRDIAIENVSLINTHRSEFSHIAANGGVDGVISELEQKLEHGDTKAPL